MEIKQSKKFLIESDFDVNPLWKYEDADDTYYPIFFHEEFPEFCNRDLFVRANFSSPSNVSFKGYIVGVINIYCIVLFYKGEKFIFNKNLPERCFKTIYKLTDVLQSDLGRTIVVADIFPLKYETNINLEGYCNVSGEFNAFEKLKDQRLLRWKEI